MKISIIIPAYNEEKSILQVVKKVSSIKLPYSKEIIVINDGSVDQTGNLLKKASKNHKIKIIQNAKNQGKGQSIKNALKMATGGIVLIQDADSEYDPNDIPSIISLFKDKNVKVVYGSRILKKNPISNWQFNLGGRLLTIVTNLLYQTKITDEATGYKAFRLNIIKNLALKSKGFEFCPEVTAKIAKKKIKIYEVPISYSPRPVEEKKIKVKDGFLAIFYLLKYRFTN